MTLSLQRPRWPLNLGLGDRVPDCMDAKTTYNTFLTERHYTKDDSVFLLSENW